MTINFGTSGIGEIFYGSTPIKEVYAGDDLVWSSGPSWPQTGTWSGNTTAATTMLASFTVPEAGMYTIEWSVTWGGTGNVGGYVDFQINGGTFTVGNTVNKAPGTSTVTVTTAMAAGDVANFWATSVYGTRPATGVWSIEPITALAHGTYNLTNGANGYYDVGTWTAPTAGTYTLYIDRLSVNYPATSIRINGQTNGGPETVGPPRARMLVRTLNAGDVVTFVLANSPGMVVPSTGTWLVY